MDSSVANNKFAAMTGVATTFWYTHKKTILIGIVIAIIAFIIYRLFIRKEGFTSQPQQLSEYQNIYQYNQPAEGFYVQNDLPQHPEKKILLFYAPWCPHCNSFMDGENAPWKIFVKKHGNRSDLTIDQINGDENPDTATKYGVKSFPTILILQGDKSYTYDGDRTIESLEKFVDSPY